MKNSNDLNIYKTNKEHNPKKKRKVMIVFEDMVADVWFLHQ